MTTKLIATSAHPSGAGGQNDQGNPGGLMGDHEPHPPPERPIMTNPTPHGQVPEALRLAALLDADEWPGSMSLVGYARACAAELLRLHAENQVLRLHAENQVLRTTHVQNPAENEHVAGDVSKNGVKLNVSTQQTAAGATPECLTCSDHGAVGNILTAEPCPDCTRLSAQPAPATLAVNDDLRDRLVAISAAIADQDDRAAQAMLREILKAPQPSPTAQADSVPAVEHEQERIAFKDAHRHLDLDEVPDAWGRPMFKHSHVEASWLGWIARASHGQAPAQPAGPCAICGSDEPFTGTCGSGDPRALCKQPSTSPQAAQQAPAKLVEAVTKAILFEDTGSSEGWEENTNLGEAAIRVCDARNPPRCSYCHSATGAPLAAPTAMEGGEDAARESEYLRGYRQGYEQRDAEVRGALV